MATHGFWFWLLINLGYDHQLRNRLLKRSIDNSGECPSLEPRKQNSFLWVMERSPPVYFFGTIHVPYTKVWNYVPLNSKQAFYTSENIYFELDLTDSVTLTTLARCQILPNRIMLKDVVPRTLFKRLKRHLSYIRKKMPDWMAPDQRRIRPLDLYKALTRNWYKKRPIWIMLLLNVLTEYDTKGRGTSVLDTFLIHETITQGKLVGSIESVEEQCEPLNALNNSQVMVALNQTLVLHEKIRRNKAKLTYSTRELIYHYNCGDLTDILYSQKMSSLTNLENSSDSDSFVVEQTRKIDEYFRDELIYKRNKRMSKRVVQLIKKHPKKSFFFAIGAGHFLGNGSIIDILRKKGYNVSHVRPDAKLPRYGKERKLKEDGVKEGSKKKKERRRKKCQRRKKCSRRHRKRMRMNIDNLWKRDPLWKAATTPMPVQVQTTKKRNIWSSATSSSSYLKVGKLHVLWSHLLIVHAMVSLISVKYKI